MGFVLGKRFDRICRLGNGSFGQVDLIQTNDGTRYAMKTGDEITMNEINRLKRIRGGPGVVRLRGWFLCGLGLCIVTEWSPYGTLRGCLIYPSEARKKEKWMDDKVTDGKLRLVYRQVDAALRHLSDHGVTHGDLHGDNVVCMRPDLMKLIDFHEHEEGKIPGIDRKSLSNMIGRYILERHGRDKKSRVNTPTIIHILNSDDDSIILDQLCTWAWDGEVEALDILPKDIPPRSEWTGWQACDAEMEFEMEEWV